MTLFHIPLLSFTVPRYLYKQCSGAASCAGTEAFILLDKDSLHSLALRYSGFQQNLSREVQEENAKLEKSITRGTEDAAAAKLLTIIIILAYIPATILLIRWYCPTHNPHVCLGPQFLLHRIHYQDAVVKRQGYRHG